MSSRLHRVAPVAGLATLILSAVAIAQLPGQVFGQIFDENNEPIEGVKITITDPESADFLQEETTDERGRYRIRLTNATVPYTVSIAKEGFATVTLPNVRVPARQNTRRNFNMTSVKTALASGEAAPVDVEAASRGGAVEIYNKGVQALNSGDPESAKTLFLEALERKSDLALAKAALARVHLDLKQYEQAVDWAQQAIALEAEVDSMTQVLYSSYSALGDDAKAKEALARLKTADPEKASLNMYNEAADLFNGGELDRATAAFAAILQTNPDHAKSHYMLGLCYVNSGDSAKAKTHFGRFLELAPNDPDAATATEMIKYLE